MRDSTKGRLKHAVARQLQHLVMIEVDIRRMTLRVCSHADEQRSSEAADAFGDEIATDESKAKDETAH